MTPIVGSYTLLNTYQICPHQAYRRYVLRDLPKVETPAMLHGIAVHEQADAALKSGRLTDEPGLERFLTPFRQLKATSEVQLGIAADGTPTTFFAKSVWFRGKLDVLATLGNSAFIGDWKTGKPREDPWELQVFALLYRALNPAVERISGAYIWLKEDKVGRTHDLSDFVATWTKLKSSMDAIAYSQKMNHWPKKQGPFCHWCNVLDCEFNTSRET